MTVTIGEPDVGGNEDEHRDIVPPPGTLVGQRFAAWLTAIAVVAFGIRLTTLATVADFTPDGGDPFWYHQQANDLIHGRWFTDPFIFQATGEHVPGAQHPPLYTMWLSIASAFGAQSYTSHKVMSCLAGVLAVVLIALAARAAAGARAGLIAGALAAVYPPLWVIDGLLWPEGLFAAMIALIVLFAFRWRRNPTLLEAAGLGVAIALATLTRGEAVGLLVLLALPLMAMRRSLPWRVRLTHLVAVGLAFVVLVAPWSIRNLVSYERFMPLSTNTDEIFVYANNPYAFGTADRQYVCTPEQSQYEGTPDGITLHATGTTYLGFWYFPWEVYQRCIGGEPSGDVSQRSEHWRKMGLEYLRDNLDRFPVVAAARVGRVWDVWRPFQNAFFLKTEGRSQTVSNIGVWCWWLAAALAIYGAVVLRRRGQTILPFVSMAVLITITAIYGYGTDRFRVPMDVAALILAGAALDAFVRARSRRTVGSPEGSASRSADGSTGQDDPSDRTSVETPDPTSGTAPGPA